MAEFDAPEISVFGKLVCLVLEEYGDGTHEDGQHLSGDGDRDGDGDTFRDRQAALDDEDGGNDTGECCIRRHGRANVHPAEGDEFERATDHDTGAQIAEDEADEGAGDERAVRLPFINDGTDTADKSHQGDEDNV